jgi:phage major head subunit gpT-like protein
MAAIALFRNWADYQGLKMDVVAMGGFYLVIPPGLEEAAGQALGSSVTSDQMQLNMAGSYGIDTIVWNHLTDADNWFLVSKAMSPLIFWERSAPDLQIEIDEDSKAGKYSLDFAIASAVNAIPDGIVGAEV